MKKEDCVELGYISKAHGLRGEVKATLDVHDIEEYRKTKTLYLSKKTDPLTEYKVKKFDIKTDKLAMIALAGVNYRDQSEALVGSTIYFPLEKLPELPEGHFYYFDVIDFQVIDQNHGELGKVQEFISGPAQDIMVMIYQDKEVLIPMTDEIVPKADMEKKVIHTNLPEGLLEIYMN